MKRTLEDYTIGPARDQEAALAIENFGNFQVNDVD